MIRTFTASPRKITEFDPSKQGQGTGIAKFATGMYFGAPSTVQHYMDQMKGLGQADRVFFHKGMEVQPGSAAYDVMDFLFLHNYDRDEAIAHFAKNKKALTAIEHLTMASGKFDFSVESGVCHAVELRNIGTADLPGWDNPIPDDLLQEAAMLIYERSHGQTLDAFDYVSAGIEHPESVEHLIDLCYDAAIKHADEHFGYSTDFDGLRAAWDAQVRRDDVHNTDALGDDFEALMNTPQWKALNTFMGHRLSLHEGMSYGSLYIGVADMFGRNSGMDANDPGKLKASQFFSEKLKIPGFACESPYGNSGSVIYVVFDEDVLKSAKFTPMSHDELHQMIEMGEHEQSHRLTRADDDYYQPSYGFRR